MESYAQSDCWQGGMLGGAKGRVRGKGREDTGQGEGRGEDFWGTCKMMGLLYTD